MQISMEVFDGRQNQDPVRKMRSPDNLLAKDIASGLGSTLSEPGSMVLEPSPTVPLLGCVSGATRLHKKIWLQVRAPRYQIQAP